MRLRRTSLQVKLVAAVLALVTAALLVISVTSTVALRSYLTGRVDEQLTETVQRMQTRGLPVSTRLQTLLPSDFVLQWRLPGADTGRDAQVVTARDARYAEADLPLLPESMVEAARLAGAPHTVEATTGEGRWRMLVTMLPDGSALTVARSMADVDSAVGRLVLVEVLVGAGVLLLLASLGAAIIRKSLRPLVQIERTAEAIADGDLSRRVPEIERGEPHTELGRLAKALNAMLAQIETAFAARTASEQRMRRFVADASHELRTPLTSIRGFAELYRQGGARSPEAARDLMRRIEDEASRMGLLVEDLLLLARLDQERPLNVAPVELPVVVADAVEAARALDSRRQVTLELDGTPVVAGDEARLRQVLDNLLGNAVTHTPAGTPVTVRLGEEADAAVVEVVDRGPGLTPEQAERVFERFYRSDAARGRHHGGAGNGTTGGTGLGLAIVAALIAAHRGTVEVDTVPGRGATFRVRLPLAAAGRTGDSQVGSRPVKG